jgi:hypothetical protein
MRHYRNILSTWIIKTTLLISWDYPFKTMVSSFENVYNFDLLDTGIRKKPDQKPHKNDNNRT